LRVGTTDGRNFILSNMGRGGADSFVAESGEVENKNYGKGFIIGHDSFLPHPFKFIVHYSY
jgi:hypothetical protein